MGLPQLACACKLQHPTPKPTFLPAAHRIIQERWLRDLMCQELLATLPALSPARRRAVDAPLVALMSYSQLQSLALGLLLDDLRWIMRTAPKELAVSGLKWAAAWPASMQGAVVAWHVQ